MLEFPQSTQISFAATVCVSRTQSLRCCSSYKERCCMIFVKWFVVTHARVAVSHDEQEPFQEVNSLSSSEQNRKYIPPLIQEYNNKKYATHKRPLPTFNPHTNDIAHTQGPLLHGRRARERAHENRLLLELHAVLPLAPLVLNQIIEVSHTLTI